MCKCQKGAFTEKPVEDKKDQEKREQLAIAHTIAQPQPDFLAKDEQSPIDSTKKPDPVI